MLSFRQFVPSVGVALFKQTLFLKGAISSLVLDTSVYALQSRYKEDARRTSPI